MELHYRGVAYNPPDAGMEFSEGEIVGQYRGAALKSHRLTHLPDQTAKPLLRYRGAWVR